MIDSDDENSFEKEKSNPNAQQQPSEQVYKIQKLLGKGAFGKAYLVKDIKEDTLWVMKRVDLTDMTQQQRDQTTREHLILESLDHPNIVKFRQIYRSSSEKLNIIMEYADGGDLAGKIKAAKENSNKYFEESVILDWFTQICLAIKHVHDRKIIHRDIKGQNVFLTSGGIVKLGDFGIARVLHKTMEKARTIVGTPYYLSPQIIQNKPYSFKSDVWSLGVLLYQMCALTPPFTGNSIPFLALRIVKGSYTSIPNCFSSGMKGLVRAMLNVDPARRPTIHQILKSGLIYNRITNFLSQSKKHEEFSHTILHNQSLLKPRFQAPAEPRQQPSIPRPPTLSSNNFNSVEPSSDPARASARQSQEDFNKGPLPEANNSKEMFFFNKSPNIKTNPKTPALMQKTPMNGFYRPPSSHALPRPSISQTPDLGDLLKINAPVLTPVVPKTPLPKIKTPEMHNKRPSTPKLNIVKQQLLPINGIGMSDGRPKVLEVKKPTSYVNKTVNHEDSSNKQNDSGLNFIRKTENTKSVSPKPVVVTKPVTKILSSQVRRQSVQTGITSLAAPPPTAKIVSKKVIQVKRESASKNKKDTKDQGLNIGIKHLGGGSKTQSTTESKPKAVKKDQANKNGVPKAKPKKEKPLEIKSEEVKKLQKEQRLKKKQEREAERLKMKQDIMRRKNELKNKQNQVDENESLVAATSVVQSTIVPKAQTAEDWRPSHHEESQEYSSNNPSKALKTWDSMDKFSSNKYNESSQLSQSPEQAYFNENQSIEEEIEYGDESFEDDEGSEKQSKEYNWQESQDQKQKKQINNTNNDEFSEMRTEPSRNSGEPDNAKNKFTAKDSQDLQKMKMLMQDIVGIVNSATQKVDQLQGKELQSNIFDVSTSNNKYDLPYDLTSSLSYSMTGKSPINVRAGENNTFKLLTQTDGQLGLQCIADPSKIQQLKVELQNIFGAETFKKMYRQFQELFQERGLDFDEDEMMKRIQRTAPEADSSLVKKHFSIIVTIICLESGGPPAEQVQ